MINGNYRKYSYIHTYMLCFCRLVTLYYCFILTLSEKELEYLNVVIIHTYHSLFIVQSLVSVLHVALDTLTCTCFVNRIIFIMAVLQHRTYCYSSYRLLLYFGRLYTYTSCTLLYIPYHGMSLNRCYQKILCHLLN